VNDALAPTGRGRGDSNRLHYEPKRRESRPELAIAVSSRGTSRGQPWCSICSSYVWARGMGASNRETATLGWYWPKRAVTKSGHSRGHSEVRVVIKYGGNSRRAGVHTRRQ